MSQINLGTPIKGGYEGKGFGREYIWTYKCPENHEVRVRCNAWQGMRRTASGNHVGITPQTGKGAIMCPHCPSKPAMPE